MKKLLILIVLGLTACKSTTHTTCDAYGGKKVVKKK